VKVLNVISLFSTGISKDDLVKVCGNNDISHEQLLEGLGEAVEQGVITCEGHY
jgi:hypothetical protein